MLFVQNPNATCVARNANLDIHFVNLWAVVLAVFPGIYVMRASGKLPKDLRNGHLEALASKSYSA